MEDTGKKNNNDTARERAAAERSGRKSPPAGASKKTIKSKKARSKSTSKAIEIRETPIFPAHDVILFPHTLAPLVIKTKDEQGKFDKVMDGDKLIALFPEIPQAEVSSIFEKLPFNPGEIFESFELDGNKLSSVGVLCRVVKKLRFPDDSLRILLRGLKRIKATSVATSTENGFASVFYEVVEDEVDDSSNVEITALTQNVITQFQEIINLSPMFPDELKVAILNIDDSVRLVDMIADSLNLGVDEKLHLLAIPGLLGRLQLLAIFLHRQVEMLKVGAKIQAQVNNSLGQSQKEIFLREQMRAIKHELGEDNKNPDIVAFEKRMSEMNLSEQVVEVVEKELERMELIPRAAPDYNVSHNYVDWLLSVPWNTWSEDRLDIRGAEKVLNEDHYDLSKVKERILEFLAVIQLKKDRKSPILCFVGPPGVGKTSLGKSIARAMNRSFVRMSLGGIRDEAEIRGHRRTYIGALPGRIIQGVKKAKTANPVFMLDELDKIGNDFRGDPASALLEVLDPQQNNAFNDHYLEIDYDLSSVMFIATANITDTIPPALLDRMEIMHLPGYTTMEKKQIARRFLLPRQLRENGLKARQLSMPMPTIESLISDYTREAGVRKLERSLGSVFRKVARKIVEGEIDPKAKTVVASGDLSEYLGPKLYIQDEAESAPEVGIATGMAWTSVGGAILPVEVTSMPGKGELKLTGSLGDVMKESAQAAFSFVRSNGEKFKIPEKTFSTKDFHIHVPDGATPKDGPSAGITMLASLVSHLTSKPLRPLTAMTGEITLRGKITPVGGIKEKVIAALAAGIKDVLLPEKNRKDLEDVPDEVKRKLRFTFASDAGTALKFLLLNTGAPKKSRKRYR
ncbi:MAG: endopeptidase La [Kiritimatiellaeota bacterium]|nr:endopeptidase La [Kiritimatiellota bacterium]